jgi:hypothetical protein
MIYTRYRPQKKENKMFVTQQKIYFDPMVYNHPFVTVFLHYSSFLSLTVEQAPSSHIYNYG